MKIYLSANYKRKEEMQAIAKVLQLLGHTIVSSWVFTDDSLSQKDAAGIDFKDLGASDFFIGFTENPKIAGYQTGGRHVEMGVALEKVIPVVLIGPKENVFHHHVNVIHVESVGWIHQLGEYSAST